ncbi:MAG TPA: GNAT family N-acetyltransferase [Polyangia bacterium]
MNSFVIRPIDDSDLPAVLEVYRQSEDFLALGPVATASPEMVAADRALSRQAGGLYCGIFCPPGGEPAGSPAALAGILDYTLQVPGQPGALYIELLMMARPYRGRGLGTAVVDWLLAQYGRQVRCLQAGVQANNPGAIRFWQRMGFRITGPARLQPDTTVAFPLEYVVVPKNR